MTNEAEPYAATVRSRHPKAWGGLHLPRPTGLGVMWKLTGLAVMAVLQLGLSSGSTVETLTLSGNPLSLLVSTALAGLQPDAVLDQATTYDVSVTQTSQIAVQLTSSLPSGLTLRVRMDAPAGAVSAGYVSLTTTAQDLVTSIPSGSYSQLTVSYEISGTVSAGVVALNTVDVDFTLTAQ